MTEHHFMCLMVFSMFYLEKYLLTFSGYFTTRLVLFFISYYVYYNILYNMYILYINPLSVIPLENIFSHTAGCLFFFVDGFLCCTADFRLNWVPLVYFCFCFLCLRRQIKNILLRLISKCLLAHVFF